MRENRHSIREFEALRAVVTMGTTIGAARSLGVSQSAVSRSLVQLESRLGRTLFVRSSGRIEPTTEALNLNATLDPLFDTLHRIEGADWTDAADEPLRFAVPPSLAHDFALTKVSQFIAGDPRRRVQLEVQASEQVVAGVLDHRFDLGLIGAKIQRSGVKYLPWRKSRAVCILPSGHPLAEKKRITPKDLDGVPFIGLVRRHGTRAQSDQLFARAGVRPRMVVETATSHSALEFARAGLGVALINPFPVLRGNAHDIEVRPFGELLEYRTSFILPASGPPKAMVREFMSFVRRTTPKDSYSETI